MNLLDARRRAPRISVAGFCGVAVDNDLHHASLTNLSTLGLRLERPYEPAGASRVIQLEIELPGLDEVVWTSAFVTRAVLTPMRGHRPDGRPRFWCRAGLRIGDTSRRERQLLRDYVFEGLRARAVAPDRRLDQRA
ncbi:MAG TPA: PilZ domain-containing protein [Kofleriaceae bacterium]|nr:PilZ domain-containing protein [Kofleriaceae bacterium]